MDMIFNTFFNVLLLYDDFNMYDTMINLYNKILFSLCPCAS